MEMKKLSYISAVFMVWDNFGVGVSGLNSWGGREQVVWGLGFFIFTRCPRSTYYGVL